MIKKVELENWKSHHSTELEFSEGVNALIGNMGSGKSSVLEAIVFGLYGTTPSHNSRDIKLDDLIRRTPSRAEEATVKIGFLIEDEEYSVERVIKRGEGTERSELRREGELIEAPSTTEVTEQVEKLLGLDFKSFSRAIYSEQNNLDLFLNMRPGDRKKRIDELLDIDRFEEARKNTVKVENNLKREMEQLQSELGELEDQISEEQVKKLENELKQKKKGVKELNEWLNEKRDELDRKKEKREQMEKQEERIEDLEQKKTKMETRKESKQERLDEIRKKLKDYENPEKELKEKKEKKQELENKSQKLDRLEQKRDHLEKEKERLEEEIEDLEEEVEEFKKIQDVEEQLQKLEDGIEDIKKKGNEKYAERETLEESLEALKRTEGECPTCGQKMDEEHRNKIITEREDRIKTLKEEEMQLKDELQKKIDRKEDCREEKEKLLEYKSSDQKLKQKKDEKREKDEELDDLDSEIEELSGELSEGMIEQLEKEISELDHIEQKKQLEEDVSEIEQKLEKTEKKLDEIEFSEEKLDKLRQEISDLKQGMSSRRQKLESEKEIIEEKEKRLEGLENQLEKKQELEDEAENIDNSLDYLRKYRVALEETQIELRQKFVSRLNELMDSTWNQLYPYDDYYSIRLNAREDYSIEVLDSENNWISVQGEVSGGERHSAALVLRLGLSYLLSPNLEILMLDEPTHNMDSSAVEKLSRVLRENSSELVEQLFIVTHDPSLESAATGELYRFRKKNTETGLTEVEEVE